LRVIVCDDEPLALERLASMLSRCHGVEIAAATTDGAEAVRKVIELLPDAIFLDIEMPAPDGFDVVEEVSRRLTASSRVPVIVFVTAYPQFALKAFESGAIDFLAKPVRLPRLEATLKRIRATVAGYHAQASLQELQDSLPGLRQARSAPDLENDHIWIQRRGEFVRVEMSKVDWIAAEGEYVRLHVGGASYLHRELIGTLAARLGPEKFLRIHRSAMVQIDRVVTIARSRHGGSTVRLRTGQELPVGRKYSKTSRRTLMPDGGRRVTH
jgi:DNA-binding LytR/AlgR family response regulator